MLCNLANEIGLTVLPDAYQLDSGICSQGGLGPGELVQG